MATPMAMDNKTEIIRDYEIGVEIGRGSYATVRKAKHRYSHSEVALKIIKRKLLSNTKFLDREVSILKKVSHPHVVPLFDIYEEADDIILVMKYIGGGDLFDQIQRRNTFTEKDASNIIRQLLEAVKYLHDSGIVHRDLKVDNILCDTKGQDLHVYVADFGLARIFDSTGDVLMQSRVGSLEYTAPEIFANKPYDKSCDLWSVGVITYILLTGLFPFADKNPMKLYEKITNVDYNWEECPDVSPHVKHFVGELLVLTPKDRYSAEQALMHPWVKGTVEDMTTFDRSSSLQRLIDDHKKKNAMQMG